MDEPRWRLVGLSLVLVCAGIGLWWGMAGGAEPIPLALPESAPAGAVGEVEAHDQEADPTTLVVHVAGAVVRPGLVSVAPGSRVADAIAAAGGLTDEAVDAAINLAAPLTDGMQVVVPSVSDDRTTAGAGGDGLVHVNQATATELEALPGVGPVLAERIAAHRESNGPFETVEDLLDVPGIGESKLEAMRDALAVP